VIGGLAVLARLQGAHRVTYDLDTVATQHGDCLWQFASAPPSFSRRMACTGGTVLRGKTPDTPFRRRPSGRQMVGIGGIRLSGERCQPSSSIGRKLRAHVAGGEIKEVGCDVGSPAAAALARFDLPVPGLPLGPIFTLVQLLQSPTEGAMGELWHRRCSLSCDRSPSSTVTATERAEMSLTYSVGASFSSEIQVSVALKLRRTGRETVKGGEFMGTDG
jgi:hypothetical protein